MTSQEKNLDNSANEQTAQELIERRMAGELPHIDIAGTDFTIDWRLKELRETAAPWNRISIRDFEISETGEEYLCFYDIENHSLYFPDQNITTLPENVVLLEIPDETILDPVATAREHGMEEKEFVRKYPIQPELKATVKPLSETGLPVLIEENRKNVKRIGR